MSDLSQKRFYYSQEEVLSRVGNEFWSKALAPKGEGVTLIELEELLRNSFTRLDLSGAKVRAFHANLSQDGSYPLFLYALNKFVGRTRAVIIVNFDQGAMLGEKSV